MLKLPKTRWKWSSNHNDIRWRSSVGLRPSTYVRAGYREKFQNRYTYVQEFNVSSIYCRFLNFGDLGTSNVRGV